MRVLRDRSPTLPAPLTSFIGRERALAEVAASVHSHRLLTLTGPGGSGKTRLSIEVARKVADSFEDGVTWIELAAVSDAALVPQTVAAAFGLRQQQGRIAGEALQEYLAARSMVIVLDNCEHVIDEAAELVTSLLREAPRVHVLATSRERLRVAGERVWPVPPLGLPRRHTRELDALLASESVRLFLDRAAAVPCAARPRQPRRAGSPSAHSVAQRRCAAGRCDAPLCGDGRAVPRRARHYTVEGDCCSRGGYQPERLM